MDPLIFSEDYYKRLDELQRRHWWCRGIRRIQASILKRCFQERKMVSVLDAGCGTGAAFSWIREQMADLACLVGFDVSSHALRINQSRPDGAPACQASVMNLPFRGENFDLVLCDDVLQHIYSGDRQALAEFHRVLRPMGWLLLRTNARHAFGPNEDPAWDFHRYSRTELCEKTRLAGFAVTQCTHVNALPSLATEAQSMVKRCQKAEEGAYSGLQLQERGSVIQSVLYEYMCVEAALIGRMKISLPCGHSILALLQKRPIS